MRSGKTRSIIQRIHDDPLVSLLEALLAYVVGSILVAIVLPASSIGPRLWIIFAVVVAAVILLATHRRDLTLLKLMLLSSVGIATLVVGAALPLYMAIERPTWLLTLAAFYCYVFAAIGACALYATRNRVVETNGAA